MDSGADNHRAIITMANMEPFRIFLASPGDVPLERNLVREAIDHISSERRFRGRLSIEIVAWDQPGTAVAMEAGMTPQEAIALGLPTPDACDLTVVILWSRIGTPLPADFELKNDGSPYLSGTEWEYLNALSAYQSTGKPAVWVYRRQGAPQLAADDPQLEDKLVQWRKLERFFAAFSNPDGSLAGGFNAYETPDDFRQQFEHHLRNRLDKLLETQPDIKLIQAHDTIAPGPCWKATPYPGLEAFTPEQAPIFFGRGVEVDQLLQQFSDAQVRFIAVVGVSGSGKSSLVKAGLLPRLRSGIIGYAPWGDLLFKPGERGGNPFLALAYEVKARLQLSGQTEQDMARSMQADPPQLQQYLTRILAQQALANELLLVVDQFEELFTQTSETIRNDFLAVLHDLVSHPQIRIIVTLRADFYARAIEEKTLAELLRRDRGTFPLDPPGISAIYQMIIRPAEASGLELQDGLAQRLLDDAGNGPGALALIAFTLNQLYQRESNSRYLSIEAYEDFGGVQGAVQKRAESALQGLTVNIDNALPKLFVHLVEVNEQEVATRRRAPQMLLAADARLIADALIGARLLVSGEGEANQPTLEVAHEAVLSGWQRLGQWIIDHAESLRARRDLEQVAAEWQQSGRPGSALRTGKLLQRYFSAAEPHSSTAHDYLAACKRRRTGFRIGNALLGAIAIVALAIFLHVNKSQYPPAFAAKALFVQLDIWPVRAPEMISVDGNAFLMGDISGEGQADERPVHNVRFSQAFQMGKYEVSFNEYDLFAAATGREKPSDEGWGRGQLPVINITWDDAVAYAQWLSGKTGMNFHLPSEAQWEYAARANTRSARYWPDQEENDHNVACTYANVFDTKNESVIRSIYGIKWDVFNCEDDYAFTAPVGTFIANQWQLHDMLGNIWEWTRDCYAKNYDNVPGDGSAKAPGGDRNCAKRVLRGGSWNNPPLAVRASDRAGLTADGRGSDIGFRLASSPAKD